MEKLHLEWKEELGRDESQIKRKRGKTEKMRGKS